MHGTHLVVVRVLFAAESLEMYVVLWHTATVGGSKGSEWPESVLASPNTGVMDYDETLSL